MLQRLKVARFKSVKSADLDLGAVNLFIGGNGSGKSSLLEAVGLASACFGRSLGDSDIAAKGMRLTPATLMKSSFKNEDLPKTLELQADFPNEITYKVILQSRDNDPLLRFFSESAYLDNKRIFGRSNRGITFGDEKLHHSRVEKHRGLWDQLSLAHEPPRSVASAFEDFGRYLIYTPQTDFLRARQGGRIDTPPIGLRGEGLSEAVASFLSTLHKANRAARRNKDRVDPNYDILRSSADLTWLPGWAERYGVARAEDLITSRDISNPSGKIVYFIDKFMREDRNRLSVYDSSEGTLFLLFAAIILSHPEASRVFALDNVDNALNPRLTRALVEQIIKVTRLSAENGVNLGARQVFLTSHNPTALDAFDLFDDRQRVFVVTRNDRGHTVATRLQPPEGQTREDWTIAMNGRNLSQLWLDGKIPGALGPSNAL